MLKHLKEYHEIKGFANQMGSVKISPEVLDMKRRIKEYSDKGESPEEVEKRRIDYIYRTEFIKELINLPIPPNNLLRSILYIIAPDQEVIKSISSSSRETYLRNKKEEFLMEPQNKELYTQLKHIITNPKSFKR